MTTSPTPAGGSQKYRPRARWFVIGTVLLLLVPVVFAVALFTVLGPLFKEDAVLPADGEPHSVSVAADSERGLFTRQGAAATCSVVDGSGADLALRSVGGDLTVNDWQAVARFDTGDGDLTVQCDPRGSATEIRVGEVPAMSSFAGGLAIGILGPVLLGGLGFVVLVVTGILWATRPARPRT